MSRRHHRARGAARAALSLTLCLALAACFGGGGARQGNVGPLDAVTGPDAGVQIGRLSPQRVESGQCGIFLWSLSASQLIFFTSTRDRMARMSLDGREVALPRLRASGAPIVAGHLGTQIFRSSDGATTLYVELKRGDLIEGGRRVGESVLRLVHVSGWEIVLPVAGIAYCRQRSEAVQRPR